MTNSFFIDVDCQHNNHKNEIICGDVFLSRKLKDENRTIVVLSDGMGSGIKANVLATLTSSMAVNFTMENKEVQKTAEIIMKTLPVCSERKISYSTFTILDIEFDGTTRIIEYDNPGSLILRGFHEFDPGWHEIPLDGEQNKGKVLKTCKFQATREDRIIFFSDGVAQSGMGSTQFPFGWGRSNACVFARETVQKNPMISATLLSRKIVNKALANDFGAPKDDTSAAVIYFRKPRKLLICTGPPYDDSMDKSFAKEIENFQGKKIICGGTTAEIISRELKLELKAGLTITDPDLPPISFMNSFDLVTEGILTLGKVAGLLEKYQKEDRPGDGPADKVVKLLLESDIIRIINGTRINVAHQDPNLPVELEIRRTVVKRIVDLLEKKFLKDVQVKFI